MKGLARSSVIRDDVVELLADKTDVPINRKGPSRRLTNDNLDDGKMTVTVVSTCVSLVMSSAEYNGCVTWKALAACGPFNTA